MTMRDTLGPLALGAILAGLSLAGCAKPVDPLVQDAEKSVKERLRDPESAQFTDVTPYPAQKVVCGKVNAKNGFGGYSGATWFYAGPDGTIVDNDLEFAAVEKCTAVIRIDTARIEAETARLKAGNR